LWSRACKEELRSYFPQTEVVFFAEQFGADSMALGESGYKAQCEELRGFVFEPLRKYLADEFASLGWNGDKLNEICGTASMAGRHYTARSQWCLPTAENYAWLQRLFNKTGEYEYLRREYEDLRRPFNVTADDAYTDVWTFPTVGTYDGKHPCEKPVAMIRQIIEASSRPGDLVLDCFAGSGVAGQVCVDTGRRAVLVEKDEHWFRQAKRRCEHKLPERKKLDKHLPLFEQRSLLETEA
jgi:site-specific DNA-methyltransferase (adenine-specific)